ncbi:hypothetical protein KC622_01175 [Candidatus Dojkabacteria bacterium]|uniref:Uncharacterized protein n=1 Tax=Candidatus Dojkabacteria bacterium TaxID=2099670 RepID=A0A955I5J6_9BACT|nr:hypothetical protein [Candidatus Dojkabacteria bacterium]
MKFLAQNLNIFTITQLILMILILIIPPIIFLLVNKQTIKNTKVAIVVSLSSILSAVVYLISAVVTQRVFGDINDGLLSTAFALVVAFNWLNLIHLLLKSFDELKQKSPDLDHITRNHFSKTLDLGVILMICGFTFIPFVPIGLAKVFIIVISSSLITIALNHLLARRFICDEN